MDFLQKERFRQDFKLTAPPPSSPVILKLVKRVRIAPVLSCMLIPTRKEFNDANLSGKLWFNEADYDRFKKAAVSELKFFIGQQGQSLTAREAMTALYQPK